MKKKLKILFKLPINKVGEHHNKCSKYGFYLNELNLSDQMRLDAAIQGYSKTGLNKSSLVTQRIRNSNDPSQANKSSESSSTSTGLNKHLGKDKVEISTQAQDRMSIIKARINSGYYKSDQVSDDITEKLTRYFDDVTN